MNWVEIWRVLNCLLIVAVLPLTLEVVRHKANTPAQRQFLLAFATLALAGLVGILYNLTKGVIFNPSTPIVTLGLILGLRAGYKALYPPKKGKSGGSKETKA